MATTSQLEPFRLGEWYVLPRENRLERGDESVDVLPKAMDVLDYLASRVGEVATYDEIIENVWAPVIANENSVQGLVSTLRRALGCDPRHPTYIETVPKRGFRLIAKVDRPAGNDETDTGAPVTSTNSSALPRLGVPAFSASSSGRNVVAIAAVAVIAATLLTVVTLNERSGPSDYEPMHKEGDGTVVRVSLELSPPVERVTPLLFTTDFLLYSGTGQESFYFIRHFDQLESRPFSFGESLVFAPFASPDDAWIGFRDLRDGRFKRIRVDGTSGQPVDMGPSGIGPHLSMDHGVHWGPGGLVVFANDNEPHIMVLSADGSDPTPSPLTMAPPGTRHRHPRFVDDDVLAFTIVKADGEESAALYDISNGRTVEIGPGSSGGGGDETVFRNVDGNVIAACFDAEALAITSAWVPMHESESKAGDWFWFNGRDALVFHRDDKINS